MSAPGDDTRAPRKTLEDPPLLLLAALLMAVFMLSRLPFFWYYPSVHTSQDTPGYLEVVTSIREGHWPHFIYRTPGYPLFFWFVTLFTNRWMAVVCAQNLLSYASSLFLVYSVRCYRPSLALPAALAMCGFLGSSQVVLYDVALLSESLYTTTIIVSVALFLAAFRRFDAAPLALASAAMACCIFVRPAGQYFLPIYAGIAGYLVLRRVPFRSVTAFLLPFPALLVSLCAYNYATLSSPAISPFAEASLVGATALFWEPDPRLPDSVNQALKDLPASYARQDITPEDLQAVRTSWDVDRLNPIYEKAIARMVFSEGWGWGRLGSGDYFRSRANMRAVSLIAIRRHPILYAKFFWVGLVEYYRGVGFKFDIESAIANREQGNLLYGMSGAHPDQVAARLAADSKGAARGSDPRDAAARSSQERLVRGLQHLWQRLHAAVFQNTAWSFAYFTVLILSTVQLARHRGRHDGAFLMVVLTLIPLGASFVICLVQSPTDRYSYPTQFIYYLCVALSPLLWLKRNDSPPQASPPCAPAS